MIKVKVEGSVVSVESDNSSEIEHCMAHQKYDLLGAMRSFGINEVEAEDYSGLCMAFDEKYKEATGKHYGYFVPV